MMNELATILTKSQMTGNDIREVVTMIDQESANSIYRRCAEEFDFKTVILDGKVYSTGDELFPVFGYSNRDVLSQILKRNGIETFSTWNVQTERTLLLQAFQLSPKTTRLNLIDYHGFLAVALEGRGLACDKVREYLLAMEQQPGWTLLTCKKWDSIWTTQ